MSEKMKERNQSVDLIKGFAIMLVVFGHVLTTSINGGDNTILHNIVWTLQLPLFMIVSGYVNVLSRPIKDEKTFIQYIGRRSLAYLLPWGVWTFLVRGLIMGQYAMLNIKQLLFNMDRGYWYLFSLWIISIVFGLAQFIAIKCIKERYRALRMIATCIISIIIGCLLLVGLMLLVAPNFLGAKLTLYYLPFFLFGYFTSWFQSVILKTKRAWGKDIIAFMATIIFFILINRHNFYLEQNGIVEVLLRAIASVAGSIMICCIIERMKEVKGKIVDTVDYIGRHSLEIYVSHYLIMLLTVKLTPLPAINSLSGIAILVVNFSIAIIGATLLSYLLNKNKVFSFILFGKYKR